MFHLFTSCSSFSLCLRLIKRWCPTSLHGSVMCLWGSMVGLGPGSVQEGWARSGKWAPKELWKEPGITGQEQLPARSPGCHCYKSISYTKHSLCIPTTSLCSWGHPLTASSYLPLPNPKWCFFVFSPRCISQLITIPQTWIQPLSVPMGHVLSRTELCFTVSVCFQCLCNQIRSNLGSAGSRTPVSVRFYLVHHCLPHWVFHVNSIP